MITIFNNFLDEQLMATKKFMDNGDKNLVYFEKYKTLDDTSYCTMYNVLSQLNEELVKRGLPLKYE